MMGPHDPTDDPKSVVLKRKMSILHNYGEIIKSGLNTTLDVDFSPEDLDIPDDEESVSVISANGKKRKATKEVKQECEECQIHVNELLLVEEMSNELIKHNDELRDHNRLLRTLHENNFSTKKLYSNIVMNIEKKRMCRSCS